MKISATPSTRPGMARGTLASVSKNRRPRKLDFSDSQATTLMNSITAVALLRARIVEFRTDDITPDLSRMPA
jgi:hypothetical protein